MDPRVYLTLEKTLIKRLRQDWDDQSSPVYQKITAACKAQQWDAARQYVQDLDLSDLGKQNREWLKYLLRACAIFGSGMAGGDQSFLSSGNFDATLNQAVANILQFLELDATTQVQQQALQLIAEDEAQHTAQKREYKYGTTHFNIPPSSDAFVALAAARDTIADDDLAGDGKEQEPHITVRYGLESSKTDLLKGFVSRQTSFTAHLGCVKAFSASDASDGAVPLVIKVQSPDLHTIHSQIDRYGDFAENTFPDYIPHVTLAYVKPGTEQKYLGICINKDVLVDALTVVGQNGVREVVPFQGSQKGEGNPYHDEKGKFTDKDHAEDKVFTDKELHSYRLFTKNGVVTSVVSAELENNPWASLGSSQYANWVGKSVTDPIFQKYFEEENTPPSDRLINLALVKYTSADYGGINDQLRRTGKSSSWKVKVLDAAMKMGPAITVYRGGSSPLFPTGPKIGQIVTEPAYLSTSKLKSVAKDFQKGSGGYHLTISVPSEVKRIDVTSRKSSEGMSPTAAPLEKEVLLDRGLSYKVVGVNGKEIHLEALPKKQVQKADASGRFVTPFVSFDNQGDDQLQLIASLNASRLATWGFTAEAAIRGVKKYKLQAVLDGRTSKFCKLVNGREFNVADARQKILQVLNVQNPNDLRTVQAWPSQTKGALDAYAHMSNDELVALGLHIPPFHPNCRTICQLVRSAGDQETPDTAIAVDEPLAEQIATPDTFKEVGVRADEKDAQRWNAEVKTSPVQVLAKLAQASPEELMDKAVLAAIEFAASGEILMGVKGTAEGVQYDVDTILNPLTDTYELQQADLVVGDSGADYVSGLIRTMIDIGTSSSASRLLLMVNQDAASYIQLGFLPADGDWDAIRQTIQDRLASEWSEEFGALQPDEQQLVTHLLEDSDPHALSALVDLNIHMAARQVGDFLLQDVRGQFFLDLTDPVAIAQAQAYLL